MNKVTPLLLVAMILVNSVAAQRRVERMDRGLVAMPTSSTQIYVSWRHFATDPDDIAYNLYYQSTPGGTATQLNQHPITNSTNYLANLSTASADYIFSIKSVYNGIEHAETGSFTLPRNSGSHRIVKDFDFAPLPEGHPQ